MKLRKFARTLPLMSIMAAVPESGTAEINQVSYIIGAIIAFFILGYLMYSLLKPDRF
jgi:K+-transporting ATPase KdpF subunit